MITVYTIGMRAGYSGVIEKAPNRCTRVFAGRHVNLSAIARSAGCSPSHLSRVFNGSVSPSLALGVAVAHSLGMTVDEFAGALNSINKDSGVAA